LADSVRHLEDTPVEIRAVTTRSVIVSIVVIVTSVLWNEWMPYYTSGSNISRSHFPMGLFFPFLIACMINLLVNYWRPGRGLIREELYVVLGSGLMAVSVTYDGLTGHFFGVLAAPDYFDSAENGWAFFARSYSSMAGAFKCDRGDDSIFRRRRGFAAMAHLGRARFLVDVLFRGAGLCGVLHCGDFAEAVGGSRAAVLSSDGGGEDADGDRERGTDGADVALAPVLDCVWDGDGAEAVEYRIFFYAGISFY